MNWTKVAIALPQIIGTAMQIAEKFKGPKTGSEKEKAVIEAIPDALAGIEGAFQIDVANDVALQALLTNYITARVALMNGISAAQQLKPVKPAA